MQQTSELLVRHATEADLPRILAIYNSGRAFMRSCGNMSQWINGYPSEALLRDDIANNTLYCITENDEAARICGVFALIDGDDPTYAEIFEGAWKDMRPYGTIHRIAGDGTHSGMLACAVAFASRTRNHLRIDTHSDNLPMQRAVARCGFEYCGVIYIADGSPRLAYDWVKPC